MHCNMIGETLKRDLVTPSASIDPDSCGADRHDVERGCMDVIPNPIDQNPCAQWRMPMDMILKG
jgi:hypothetical protein